MVRFVQFAKKKIIENHKINSDVVYKRRVEIIQEAQRLLADSNKNAATKNRIKTKLDKVLAMGAFKTTCTSAFVKQEMTFEPKMSRMISAREETIR